MVGAGYVICQSKHATPINARCRFDASRCRRRECRYLHDNNMPHRRIACAAHGNLWRHDPTHPRYLQPGKPSTARRPTLLARRCAQSTMCTNIAFLRFKYDIDLWTRTQSTRASNQCSSLWLFTLRNCINGSLTMDAFSSTEIAAFIETMYIALEMLCCFAIIYLHPFTVFSLS